MKVNGKKIKNEKKSRKKIIVYSPLADIINKN